MRRRAIAARPPGGEPESESRTLLLQLNRQFGSKVERENARVQDLTARRLASRLGSGRAGQGAPPPGPNAPGTGPAPTKPPYDPCGTTFDLKSINATPPLDPGEKIVVEGCGFGEHTIEHGDLVLVGDGLPSGRLALTVSGWFPTWIAASVPMISGVRDLPSVRLPVVLRGGRVSNWLDVGGFKAAREDRQILRNDLHVTCGASSPADDKECLAFGGNPAESKFFSGASLATKRARTTPRRDDCDAADRLDTNVQEKTDSAAVTLLNGWVLAGYNWWWGGDDGWVLAPSGYVANATSATISMKTATWVNGCGGPYDAIVRYRVDLFAVGPRGVPCK